MFGKRKVAAIVAEFLGTGVLTLLILSVQRTQLGIPLFVGLAAGLALVVMTFAIYRVSGAHMNPALTLAMWTARKTSTLTAICYIAAQMLGALGTYYLYRYFASENPAVMQSLNQDINSDFHWRILISEMVGTAIFAFAVASALYQRFTTAMTASMAGLGYAIGIIAAGTASIGLLNPAVALGVHAWVWATYVLGPVLGAVVGVNLYGLLFAEPEVASANAAVAQPVRGKRTIAPAKKAAGKKKPARTKKK